jgi:Zn-dependent peptidase ImmA (M78 family)/transcriptional regulator with XRE-family HTH domain
MSRNINPEMLVLARESRGITQSELAKMLSEALGTSRAPGNLSKIESGLIQVSDDLLDTLVELLHYPRHFFYQTDRIYGYGSTCIYHRKRQSLPVTALRKLMAQINVIRIQVGKLLNSVEIDSENQFFRMDSVDYDGHAEHIASIVRRKWGLAPGPVDNLTNVIENAGGIVIRCPFGTNKIDAMSQWVAGQLPLFFVNEEIPTDRSRFTLAHEVGHVIMHQIPTPDMEKEADRFASEFLMPAEDIRPHLSPVSLPRLASLKPYWKVSMAALLMRASDLGKITSRQKTYLWTQMGKQGFRLKEPVEIPPEKPTVLQDIIDVHLNDHGYDIVELSHLVASFDDEFRKRFLPPPPPERLRIITR